MIKINKWFHPDDIEEYKNKIVSVVLSKTNQKYSDDNITYLKFGNISYQVNVCDLLTLKFDELLKRYPDLSDYIYLLATFPFCLFCTQIAR